MFRQLALSLFGVLFIASFAHATPQQPQPQDPNDQRFIYELEPGSTFTLKQDLYILAGNTGAAIPKSQAGVVAGCFLQSYYAKSNDRVVRTGRVLELTDIAVNPNFFILQIDDGREDHVLTQIGCNVNLVGVMPRIGDLRRALKTAFDLDFQVTPIEEVFLPIGL